jgi:hypothetical protein
MLERRDAAALPTSRPAAVSIGVTLAAAVTVLVAVVAPASAQIEERPRTVVLRFEGWRAEAARRAAVTALRHQYEIVDEAMLIDTAAEIEVDVSTPEGMAAVVERIGVALVIGGFVEHTGRRATTTVWVMDVRGNELSRRSARGPTGRVGLRSIGEAAAAVATEALAVLRRPEPEPERAPTTEPPPVLDDPAEEPVRHVEEVDVSGRWNQPFVRALVGLRIRNRTAAVQPNASTQRFDAEFFPDIQLMIEARPFARDPGGLRGLYAALSGGFSAGLGYYRLPPNDEVAVPMQTASFGVDVGYGLVLGEMVELVLSAGFGLDGFLLSDGTPADFPSVLYAFIRPAVQGRISIVERSLLVLELGFAGRIGIDAGEIQRFGPSGSSAHGIDFHAGLAGQLDFGLSWAARFAYSTYFLGFSGSPTAESGTDEAVQLVFLVGWSF